MTVSTPVLHTLVGINQCSPEEGMALDCESPRGPSPPGLWLLSRVVKEASRGSERGLLVGGWYKGMMMVQGAMQFLSCIIIVMCLIILNVHNCNNIASITSYLRRRRRRCIMNKPTARDTPNTTATGTAMATCNTEEERVVSGFHRLTRCVGFTTTNPA